jgi:hypothetical protein
MAPLAEMAAAPQCAELGRKLGECLDANLPSDLAGPMKVRRSELEQRVADLEKRLQELQGRLEKLNADRR